MPGPSSSPPTNINKFGTSCDGDVMECMYCSFTSCSLPEMTSHRWEVHPLLARRKQHLMTSSPQNGRKRPNSESSEEGKYADSEEAAPKKKASPRHVTMTSFNDDVKPDEPGHDVMLQKNGHKGSKSSFIAPPKCFNVSEDMRRSRDTGVCKSAGSSPRSESEIDSSSSQGEMDDNTDLYTLAKAAWNAPPIMEPPFVSHPSNINIPMSNQRHYVTYNNVAPKHHNEALLPLRLDEQHHGLQSLASFFASTSETSSPQFHLTHPFPHNISTRFSPITQISYPPGISVSSSPSYLPSPNNFPVYFSHSNPPPNPDNSALNKLSALSNVATNFLIKSQESNDDKPRDHTLANGRSLHHPDRSVAVTRKNLNDHEATGVTVKKQSPPHVRHLPKNQALGDDRLKSLEEALSKVDCCDPEERTNLLPYKCPDGKWRMVRTNCVGGAWVIHIPGAPHPSVYVPHQKTNENNGILDSWLRDRLTSHSSNHQKHDHDSNKSTQQRHNATSKVVLSSGRGARVPVNTGVTGGAIKSLLLKKAAMT